MEEHVATPNRHNKREAIIRLEKAISFSSCEQALWFAVLERTILDIGMGFNKRPYLKHNLINSDRYFKKNDLLDGILESAGVDRGYLFRILKENDVWPLPDDYYTH